MLRYLPPGGMTPRYAALGYIISHYATPLCALLRFETRFRIILYYAAPLCALLRLAAL
jgi:hypothetical protein